MKVMRLFALILALTLIAAACNTESVDDPTNVESDGGGDGETANTVVTVPDSIPDLPDSIPDLPDSIPDLPGLSDECEALAGFFLGIAQLIIGDVGDGSSLLDSSKSELPGSLQDDVDVVAEAADAYRAVFEELGVDFSDPASLANLTPAQLEQMNQASEGMSAPEVEEALDNIEAYGLDACDNFIR